MPVNGSFGDEGADGLWRNRPSALDILEVIDNFDRDGDEDLILLHSILEAGSKAAGQGLDAMPYFNSTLMNRITTASIEPIVFPDESGIVSPEDTRAVHSLIKRVDASLSASCASKEDKKMLLISPDRPCYDALFTNTGYERDGTKNAEFAVRDGANGSFIDNIKVPSATLKTADGAPMNPTGAGNAYAGAYAACRASGSSVEDAASIANAVGALVCEYENLPPWTWDVVERIAEAACEVKGKIQMSNVLKIQDSLCCLHSWYFTAKLKVHTIIKL